MKKVLCLILVLVLSLTLFACRGTGTPDPATTDPATTDPTTPAEVTYKIGIITGTVSQGEEEFAAAQEMIAKYGADKIITATYPDNFSSETEATIAQVESLAADPLVKAIVFCQAVPGAAAAIDKVRETKPDMLFICGVVAEDPATVASKADICLLVDEISMGTAVIKQAAAQGAKTFVHISFARHLSYATIAARRELFIQTCKELNIEYVEATAPDPTGDAGVPGAQTWIIENVPQYVQQYGKDTAFFSTNCSMQEPLIRTVAEQGAIFPQQCCPSPYHGYPAAFGIDAAGHEGDVQFMMDAIKEKVAEAGNSGRMSTWAIPVNMLMIRAGTAYAIEFCEGRTNGRNDKDVLLKCIEDIAGAGKATITLYNTKYNDDPEAKDLENFYLIFSSEFVNF